MGLTNIHEVFAANAKRLAALQRILESQVQILEDCLRDDGVGKSVKDEFIEEVQALRWVVENFWALERLP